MLTPFPSATAFALALGVRLTLRGLTLRRNPWTFGVRVSHPHYRYSCQHSHFRCLQQRSRATFTGLRNAPLPRSEDRGQISDIRCGPGQTLQHAGDLPVFPLPALGHIAIDIAEIAAVERPHLHLVCRSRRHHQKATELGFRPALPAEPFDKIGANRFRCPPDLVGERPLLDPREFEAHFVYFQRQPIGSPEYLEVLEPPQPLHSEL